MDEQLTKKDVEALVQKGIKDYMIQKQYSYSKIAAHEHNGIDTPQLKEVNLIHNKKVKTIYSSAVSEVVSIPNIQNLSSVLFQGIAFNGSKVAIVNGNAEFGNCVVTDGVTDTIIPNIQSCNFLYIDSASLANTYIGVSSADINSISGYIVRVKSNSTTVVAQIIISYQNSILTFNTTLAAGWTLSGVVTIT